MHQNQVPNTKSESVAPFFTISRHRLGVDGKGVTTLVAFQGCPLRCKHCLNIQCWTEESIRYRLTPDELLSKVKIDDLYFRTTGGGICFGGGEPAVRAAFINSFRKIAPPSWKFTIETSLNVPKRNIESLLDVVDFWIVDIKDLNPDIYLSYTTMDNAQVFENLKLLSESKARCLIRVPLIPGFNTKADCDISIRVLKEMVFDNFNLFRYVIRMQKTKQTNQPLKPLKP